MVLFFLLDTGMLAARRTKTLLEVGAKLVLFELLSLSVTFPFNISVGIPRDWGAIRLLIG